MRELLGQIPGRLDRLQLRVAELFDILEMLHKFLHQLPDEDLNAVYRVKEMPEQISRVTDDLASSDRVLDAET